MINSGVDFENYGRRQTSRYEFNGLNHSESTTLLNIPMREAIDSLSSDNLVKVDNSSNRIAFIPRNRESSKGIIFYPGGLVDCRAYAPLAKEIAMRGYNVIIVKMPLNLAVFGTNNAGSILNEFNHTQKWVIAGHSLGGVFAARFAHNNPGALKGIIFLASYPDVDLSHSNLRALCICGTNDRVMNIDSFYKSMRKMPEDTRFIRIDGANHANFGYYGNQFGDGTAEISREAQQYQTVRSIVDFVSRI
jgi:hypothetical protein